MSQDAPELRAFPSSLRDRWEPLGVLGEGAMGRVYRCLHRHGGFEAAVKVLLHQENAALRARTQREAEALASLRHPGLVVVHEGGTTPGGEAYLAMELLEGRDLEEGPAPGDPWACYLQVARALEAIHDAGLVHRDVKPANILLTPEGRAVLVDFGLVHDPERTRLTVTGQLTGTAAYLAPELIRGGPPSAAGDWYAWGVSLYQSLEGGLPFTQAEIQNLFTGRPVPLPPITRLPEGSPRHRALSGVLWPDPGERLQGLARLEATLAGSPGGWQPPGLPSPEPSSSLGSRGISPPQLSSSHSILPDEPSPGRPRWGVALVGLAFLTALLWPGAGPTTSPQEAREASPAASPESAPVDPLPRERALRLEERIRQIRARNPIRDSPFGVSWHLAETPWRTEEHVARVLRGEDDTFTSDWEGLVQDLEGWLVQLKDWEGAGPPAFERTEVRELLNRQAVPQVMHMIEDFLVHWAIGVAPRTVSLLTDFQPREARRQRDVMAGCTTLRFFLEDWQDPPPALLALRLFVPVNLSTPGPGLDTHRQPLMKALENSRDPDEQWILLRAAFHALTYSPWVKSISWEERRDLVQWIHEFLASSEVVLSPGARRLLQDRLLPEICRLARTAEDPDTWPDLEGRFLEAVRRVRLQTDDDPETVYGVLWCSYKVCTAGTSIFYQNERPPRAIAKVYREELLRPLGRLRKRLAREGRTSGPNQNPDYYLNRERLRGRAPTEGAPTPQGPPTTSRQRR